MTGDSICLANFISENFQHIQNQRQLQNYRAILVTTLLWHPGMTITVAFLNGTQDQHRQVKQAVLVYLQPYVNLVFTFISSPEEALVRILFDPNQGYVSYIGIRQPDNPLTHTMNLRSADEPHFILHEFGHVLGMVHEHLQISCRNDEEIYKYMEEKHNYSRQRTHAALLMDISVHGETLKSTYDPHSIMHYKFPASWTCDNIEIATPKQLSDKDKTWIKLSYPYKSSRTQPTLPIAEKQTPEETSPIVKTPPRTTTKLNSSLAGLIFVLIAAVATALIFVTVK